MGFLPNPAQGQDVRAEPTTFRVGNTGAGAIGAASRQLGRGAVIAGQGLTEGALDLQEQIDETDAITGLATARQLMVRTLYDPQSGALRKLGAEARNVTGVTLEQSIEPNLQRIRDELSPNAQRIFDFRIAPELQSTYRVLAEHEATQLQSGLDMSRDLNAKTMRQKIGVDWRNMKGLAADLELLDAYTEEQFSDRPLTPEALDNAKAIAAGEALKARATNAVLAGAVDVAESLLTQYGPEAEDGGIMDEYSAFAIRDMIDDSRWTQISLDWSLRAARASGAGSVTDAQAYALENATSQAEGMGLEMTPERRADLRANVISQIDAVDKDVKRIERIQIDQAMTEFGIVMQANVLGVTNEEGQLIATPNDVITAYNKATRMLLQTQDADAVAGLDKLFNNWRDNPTGSGYAQVTDTVMQMAFDGMTDEQIAAIPEATFNVQYRGYFTKGAWDDIVERRRGAGEPGSGETLKHDGIRDLAIERLKDAGFISQGLQVKWEDRATQQRGEVSATIALVKQMAAGDWTRETINRAISEVMMEKAVTSKHSFWGEQRFTISELYDAPLKLRERWPAVWSMIETRPGYEANRSKEWWVQQQLELLAPEIARMLRAEGE